MNRIISAHTPATPDTEGTARNRLFAARCARIQAILDAPDWVLYIGDEPLTQPTETTKNPPFAYGQEGHTPAKPREQAGARDRINRGVEKSEQIENGLQRASERVKFLPITGNLTVLTPSCVKCQILTIFKTRKLSRVSFLLELVGIAYVDGIYSAPQQFIF